MACIEFQVVPPCGGHLIVCAKGLGFDPVSSRAPVWGASHSGFEFSAPYQVSSRAPVWGASSVRSAPPREARTVSSRAPVWGASRKQKMKRIVNLFQVVPPCGGHPDCDRREQRPREVSSRAPVWGASRRSADGGAIGAKFQVVPPCGGHLTTRKYLNPYKLFQVVPPCGGHLFSQMILRFPIRVSSRAPVWGASHACPELKSKDWFQVVPPCGGHL